MQVILEAYRAAGARQEQLPEIGMEGLTPWEIETGHLERPPAPMDVAQSIVPDPPAHRASLPCGAYASAEAQGSASSQGSRLLKNDKVRARIRELAEARSRRTALTADRMDSLLEHKV